MARPTMTIRSLKEHAKAREKVLKLRTAVAKLRLKVTRLEHRAERLRTKIMDYEERADRLDQDLVPPSR